MCRHLHQYADKPCSVDRYQKHKISKIVHTRRFSSINKWNVLFKLFYYIVFTWVCLCVVRVVYCHGNRCLSSSSHVMTLTFIHTCILTVVCIVNSQWVINWNPSLRLLYYEKNTTEHKTIKTSLKISQDKEHFPKCNPNFL